MSGPIGATTEMLVGGVWTDITEDVREDDPISISRGRKNEGNKTDPGKMSLKVDNRHGKYSPRNPNSPWYGLIGRNTPIRVRVGDPPEAPADTLTDTFTRSEASGWGTSDTGDVWTVISSSTGTISVDGSVGVHEHTSLGTPESLALSTPLELADFEVTFRFRADTAPVGEGNEGHVVRVMWRGSGDFEDGYECFIQIGSSTGRPDERLNLSSEFQGRVPDGNDIAAGDFVNADGVVLQPDDWVNTRLRVAGPNFYIRFWTDDQDEPEFWHNQGWDDTYTEAGLLGFTTSIDASDTPTPVTFEFDDISVKELTEEDIRTRFTGEVSEWPLRWDVSGNDRWMPLKAAGIMRRLDQGNAPLGSTMSYMIPTYLPLGYWPLEEGLRGDVYAASGLEDGTSARVQGLDFAENDLLLGSRPLPVVGVATERGHILTPPVEMADTGVWEANMMLYVAEDDYPSAETEIMRVTSTGTASEWRFLLHDTGAGGTDGFAIRMIAYDEEGAELANDSIFTVDGVDTPLIDEWRQLRLTVRDDGSDVSWRYDWVSGTGLFWGNGGSFTGSVGKVLSFVTNFGDEATGIGVGHLSLWGSPTTRAYFRDNIAFAHGGDFVRNRLARISAQAQVPITVIGRAQTLLGPQPFDASFLDVAREAAQSDGGILFERRDQLGLVYVDRHSLYNYGRTMTADEATEEEGS